MIGCTFVTTCMPKLKHLKDTQCTRKIVYNHRDELWEELHHQNNSRLIDQEDIIFWYRKEHYQLWWKNVLMMKMIITVKIILITSSKWLESTLKRNKSMNKLFIKSFVNDIDWRIIEEENSCHMHEDSIIKHLGWSKNLPSLFKIWFGRI